MESVRSEEKLRFGNSTLPPRKNTEEGGAEDEEEKRKRDFRFYFINFMTIFGLIVI